MQKDYALAELGIWRFMKLGFITKNVCTWVLASQSWNQGHFFLRRDRAELEGCDVPTMAACTECYDKRWGRFAEFSAVR